MQVAGRINVNCGGGTSTPPSSGMLARADACALVRDMLTRAVSGFYESRAQRRGLSRPRAGAVAFVRRFESALRLNVHFHEAQRQQFAQ